MTNPPAGEIAPSRMPVVFVGHGTPLNAIDDNAYTRSWAALGAAIRPRAILSVSAHWYTRGLGVTAMERPRTIYDFGYRHLGHLVYPAPGDPDLARRTADLLQPRRVALDQAWGLDHGTWSVLLKAFPAADVPVVQLSVDALMSPQEHFEVAQALRPLRDEGVLIMATGNIVHNLERSIRSGPDVPYDWAVRFDERVGDLLLAHRWADLVDYEHIAEADLAVPTPDHYLPLLYALGASDDDDKVSFPTLGITRGSMSMRSVLLGS